jgi:hypothetical protein
MNSTCLPAACCLTSALALLPTHAVGGYYYDGDFNDPTPLYREVNAANPGLETVMPYIVRAGKYGALIPATVTFSFRVFPARSTNRLYATASRTFNVPRPCSTANFSLIYNTDDSEVLALPGSTRTHIALTYRVECEERGTSKSKSLVFVYSANVAAANGAVWTKTFDNRAVKLFQGVDTDGNGIQDSLMLNMYYENTTGGATDRNNTRIVILNQTTGAVISDVVYETQRAAP